MTFYDRSGDWIYVCLFWISILMGVWFGKIFRCPLVDFALAPFSVAFESNQIKTKCVPYLNFGFVFLLLFSRFRYCCWVRRLHCVQSLTQRSINRLICGGAPQIRATRSVHTNELFVGWCVSVCVWNSVIILFVCLLFHSAKCGLFASCFFLSHFSVADAMQ